MTGRGRIERLSLPPRRNDEETTMDYLLEVQWSDPVARAVARILSELPADVEQTTGAVPLGLSRGFAVLHCARPDELADIAQAVTAAGADVRVTAVG